MQAEALHEPRVRVATPWLALAWWIVATTVAGVLCFPVAEALFDSPVLKGWGLRVVWGMNQSTAGGLPEAVVTGAIIGLAQALVLAAYLGRRLLWLWPVATALGLVLGIIAWASLSRPVNGLNLHVALAFAVAGAILVTGVGLCQWLVLLLMLRAPRTVWWLPATILAGAALWSLLSGLSILLSQQFGRSMSITDTQALAERISITIAFILYGAITGLTLVLLLRKPLNRL